MGLFVISWMDKPGALPHRLAARRDHLDHLAAYPGMVKLAGPYLEDGEMASSLLIVAAGDPQAARAFHDADPYRKAGAFEQSTVRPCA